jgi:tRNA-modifying protein YgfZ
MARRPSVGGTADAGVGSCAVDRTSWEGLAGTGDSADWTFGTGANSARIDRLRPHEILAKTKMSTIATSSAAASETLGMLAFRGPDGAKFLQGQLSAEVEKLAPGARTLAGLHNPQGRVIALLDLTRRSPEELLAVLPLELLSTVATRLRKYVLRAKVRVEELPDRPTVPDVLGQVRAGIPQVFAATSETFVAQMLNLDLLDAIAFDKGCYTGQEVIARAHYRGRVKRRLQRWLNASGIELTPGDSARAADGRALSVVRVARDEQGRQELLAVGNFAPQTEVAGVEDGDAPAVTAVEVSGPLPLPYALPA